MHPNKPRNPRVWTVVKKFWVENGKVLDDASGNFPTPGCLVVSISSSGGYKPQFSASLGTVGHNGVNPHISMKTEVINGFQFKVRNVAEDASKLFARAEEYISVEQALAWDEEVDRKIQRETKQLNQGKPQVRVTGKTAKKKALQKGAA
jgi:hypothetical protein